MARLQQQFVTLTCDGPECKNTVTYDATQEANISVDIPWFKTIRIAQNAQGRNFLYCSDICEIANVGLGAHNPVEPRTIVVPEGANAQAIAAANAKAAQDATKALKTGSPVTLGKA